MKSTMVLINVFLLNFSITNAQITSAGTGKWNESTTWVGGNIPDLTSNVVILSGHTVTLDIINAECNNLTISGTVRSAIDGVQIGITIYGSLTINSTGAFRSETRSPASAANSFVEHTLNIYGNLVNSGIIDLRAGSDADGTSNGFSTSFLGSGNSTISLQGTIYEASSEEFGSITINKTGGAKVILAAGNLFMLNSSSVGPVYLTFVNGIIETGNNIWVALSTDNGSVVGASSTRYVSGSFGRGMNLSAGTEKKLDIGDEDGYRPISIRSSTGGTESGHYVYAKIVKSAADNGSSYLLGFDSVSSIRYFQVGYSKGGIVGAADSMLFEQMTPTYKADDGVTQGSTGLMVAYSTDNRAMWNNAGPPNHVVDLSNPPTELQSSILAVPFKINAEGSFYIALGFVGGAVTGPIPDSADSKYGPHSLHQYDFWKAVSDSATPLLVYVHGGGFIGGSKSDIPLSFVKKLLEKKISVMAINYRLSPEVIVPDHYLDCARAIQYARYHAAELNINPDQIGAGGISAGALASFWLAFHDDLKDPLNSDPILRMSSRVKAITCWHGQTTVDIRVAPLWVGDIVLEFSPYFGGTIFGLTPSTMNTPEAYALQEMASPVTHITFDDPPVWMCYSMINPPTTSIEAIHHINFGYRLQDYLNPLGIESIILTQYYPGSVIQAAVDFLYIKLKNDSPVPIELNSFTANVSGRNILLNWETTTEVSSYKFVIERSMHGYDNQISNEWIKVAEVPASGNSNSPRSYSFTDKVLNYGKYSYRLKMIDVDGTFSYSKEVEAEVALPKEYSISQNYPNPFNPTTRIDYQLPFDSKVSLELYGITGEKVATILNGDLSAGFYSVEVNASVHNLTSGVYVYRMTANSGKNETFTQIKKLILMK